MIQDYLVLVAYYIQTDEDYLRVLGSFLEATGARFHAIVVVENHSPSPCREERGLLLNGTPIRIIPGSNQGWEFSGWLAGIEWVTNQAATQGACMLINDSYLRNWNTTSASEGLLRTMLPNAHRGYTSIWMDVMDWSIFPPRIRRRANSRILTIPNEHLKKFSTDLAFAITHANAYKADPALLFTPSELDSLNKFFGQHEHRWETTTRAERLLRVWVEHSLPSMFPPSSIKSIPPTVAGSILYRLRRLLTKEKR